MLLPVAGRLLTVYRRKGISNFFLPLSEGRKMTFAVSISGSLEPIGSYSGVD